jgi:CRISPR/Cas system-associated exonuclease Cas4 (RecB family)
MRTIRASEISAYLYCRRAWWYGQEGYESENHAELAGGHDLHQAHSRKVVASGFQRLAAVAFLLASVIALTAYLTGLLLAAP